MVDMMEGVKDGMEGMVDGMTDGMEGMMDGMFTAGGWMSFSAFEASYDSNCTACKCYNKCVLERGLGTCLVLFVAVLTNGFNDVVDDDYNANDFFNDVNDNDYD